MNADGQPFVLAVDGTQWDLSNLAVDGREYPSPRTRPDRSRRYRMRRDTTDPFVPYPSANEIPAALNVDEIFSKLNASKMLKTTPPVNPCYNGRGPVYERDRPRRRAPSPEDEVDHRHGGCSTEDYHRIDEGQTYRRRQVYRDNLVYGPEDVSRSRGYDRQSDLDRKLDDDYRRGYGLIIESPYSIARD